jgi:hypothetical protein
LGYHTNAKYYCIQRGEDFLMQRKEPVLCVAALRKAEGDTVMRKKDRCNDARMFWIGIRTAR